MLYFAYVSNMLFDQVRQRCPSVNFVCADVFEEYRLAFTRTARGRWAGLGVADVVPANGGRVWGAEFQIDERDIGTLGKSEGYRPERARNAYRRIEVQVSPDGKAARPLPVRTYVVCEREESSPIPHRDYVTLIIDGARSWDLPADYVRILESVEMRT